VITGLGFFAFLITVAAVYWLVPRQSWRRAFLACASLGWIAWHDRWAAVVAVALTLFAFAAAHFIEKHPGRVLYHRCGVVGLVLALVACKYLGLLTATLDSLLRFVHAPPLGQFEQLLMPLGISYITFKYISYLTDVHWRLVKRGQFFDLLCYGSLFTIFVAGPIERFERFAPQVGNRDLRFDTSMAAAAFPRIVFGLFKKLVIADWVGYAIAPVWQRPDAYGAAAQVLAFVGYSIQIYLDFSGYSDIAIGSSRLFGLTIMENFDWPYLQPNISQFWRHWHISLSDWIRDYIFFPLSQWRQWKPWNLVAVPIIAMSLCGLWHGAAWHFLAWGAWHGAGIAGLQGWNAYKRRRRIGKLRGPWGLAARVAGTLATFTFVTAGWVLFRS
jgi:alginate O-acetyltransferase complex protein AlgI